MNIPLNFQFNITNGTERRLIVLRKTPHESLNHIILKLFAYLVFFEDNLRIEINAPQHYKPDLVEFDKEYEWKIMKWIDCGEIDTKKLLKVSKHNRQAEICIFKSSEESAQVLKNKMIRKMRQPSNVCYFIFDKKQIQEIEQILENRNKITIFDKNLNQNTSFLHFNFNNKDLRVRFDIWR